MQAHGRAGTGVPTAVAETEVGAMSTPQSRRPDESPTIPADDDDLDRFRTWLVERGFAERTARLWENRVRSAFGSGVVRPDEVDGVFPNLAGPSRCSLRKALREWIVFRETASGSSRPR
jgi:hypothetical protein